VSLLDGGPDTLTVWAEIEILDEPAPHNGSARTRHVTVLLRARAPEDAPDG
jgi:hypothetical protein